LDAAEAVCIVNAYVPAFQCIQLALEDEIVPNRYKPTAVRGFVVLVIDGWTGIGRAIVELLLLFGNASTEVYATGPARQHNFITSLGAQPIDCNEKNWPSHICGNVDLAFDGTCHDGFTSSYRSLNDAGVLICFGMNHIELQTMRTSCLYHFDRQRISHTLDSMPRAKLYDGIWECFNKDRNQFKDDLHFLFSLLLKGNIWPKVACRVPLVDVPRAQKKLQKEGFTMSGFIVCEPWS